MNNREIKFRAWDKIKNKMYHFNEFWLDSEYQSIAFSLDDKERKLQEGNYSLDFYQEDLSELMQFTGLHDKNGKEIYCGDIVKYDYGNPFKREIPNPQIREIIFKDGCFSLKDDDYYYNASYDTNLSKKNKNCEVIGNIYENPELLTK